MKKSISMIAVLLANSAFAGDDYYGTGMWQGGDSTNKPSISNPSRPSFGCAFDEVDKIYRNCSQEELDRLPTIEEQIKKLEDQNQEESKPEIVSKPAESKPEVASKPTESKPEVASKPTESKPEVVSKPAESKPEVVSKPTESKYSLVNSLTELNSQLSEQYLNSFDSHRLELGSDLTKNNYLIYLNGHYNYNNFSIGSTVSTLLNKDDKDLSKILHLTGFGAYNIKNIGTVIADASFIKDFNKKNSKSSYAMQMGLTFASNVNFNKLFINYNLGGRFNYIFDKTKLFNFNAASELGYNFNLSNVDIIPLLGNTLSLVKGKDIFDLKYQGYAGLKVKYLGMYSTLKFKLSHKLNEKIVPAGSIILGYTW